MSANVNQLVSDRLSEVNESTIDVSVVSGQCATLVTIDTVSDTQSLSDHVTPVALIESINRKH